MPAPHDRSHVVLCSDHGITRVEALCNAEVYLILLKVNSRDDAVWSNLLGRAPSLPEKLYRADGSERISAVTLHGLECIYTWLINDIAVCSLCRTEVDCA